jgi:uncharacterized protein
VQCGSNQGAADASGASGNRNNLSAMDTNTITVNGNAIDVWLAASSSEREYGLMRVTEAEMAPSAAGHERGMLFVFDREQVLQFWMKNTIIPLDIAFARNDGRIVQIHTMAPNETRLYSSVLPASMALEVKAGLLHKLGVAVGDTLQIPETVLKPRQR